jgi:hypothetical protein
MSACLPELIPSNWTSDEETRTQGKNKKATIACLIFASIRKSCVRIREGLFDRVLGDPDSADSHWVMRLAHHRRAA